MNRVLRDRLTYLERSALKDLYRAVRQIERTRTPGAIVEAGVALGGSAIVLATAKRDGRPMVVYDTFGLIPPPSESDGPDVQSRYTEIASGRSEGIAGDTYFGYQPDLFRRVQETFDAYGVADGVRFVQGLYEDTFRPEFPVALAHIDCDWYESVMTCLLRLEPVLVSGGRIVVDDYDTWSGCRAAVDEFLSASPSFRTERHARLHLVHD